MRDACNLLGINLDAIKTFPELAAVVTDVQTERNINKNISRLKSIEERMLMDNSIEVSQQSIEEVIEKVKKLSAKDQINLDNWTTRELRIVSYYMMKLRSNKKAYYFALKLLDDEWKSLYFNGLVFYLLNSWNSLEEEYREATSALILKKLAEYTDNNRRYILFKNNANLFEANGPLRMEKLLIAKKLELKKAPEILGFKASAITQSYYSDVIIRYIIDRKITNYNDIEEIIDLHNLDRTKKLVFAHLVELEDAKGDAISRAHLCKFINRKLGDVTLKTTWAPFPGATNEDAQKLKNASKLVYMWFAQQIIEVFFEICVQDPERKKFWLKYVNNLSSFKIVGSALTKKQLMQDSRINTMFYKHFITTNSYSSQTSALVLFIKNKMIVEFSDTGALYVYNQTHPQVKLITSINRSINSTNDLKIPSMDQLIELGDYNYYNEEGKMHHRGNWVPRLTNWMNRIVLNRSNLHTSIFDTRDDGLFTAKPLDKE